MLELPEIKEVEEILREKVQFDESTPRNAVKKSIEKKRTFQTQKTFQRQKSVIS